MEHLCMAIPRPDAVEPGEAALLSAGPALSGEMDEELALLESEGENLLKEMTPGNAAATMTLLGDCATRYGCLLHQREGFQSLAYAITSVAMLLQGHRPPAGAGMEGLRNELAHLLAMLREWRKAPEGKRQELEWVVEEGEERLRAFYSGV